MIRKYTYGNPFCTDAVVKEITAETETLPYLKRTEQEGRLTFSCRLGEKDLVYGLGENVRGINKRGWLYKSCCADEPNHLEDRHSLYASHNFLVIAGETTFGVFFDYPGIISFDVGYTHMDELVITLEEPDADVYILEGSDIRGIIKEFRGLIGRSYIPPRWAFGYQQSRWGNKCEADIREVAEEGAIMLNYSNPNAMATWACNKYGGVKTIGLCHGEIHGEQQIAEVLGIPREELDIICAGINHQTWYISVKHHGEDLLQKILPGFEAHEKFSEEEKVRIDMLKRFGYYSTESNGHLSEYVSWYRKRPDEIKDWINLDNWINGETGGYLRVTREERNWFDTDYPKILAEEPKKLDGSERGKEHCSYIIESLETGKKYRGHFNMMNEGCITNLPYESVVEVPCYVDGNGISVPKVGDLPLGCAAVCSQSIWVQKLAVEAAVHGDAKLLKQAALMDPLTGAVCNPPEVWQMIDEMLVAQEQWLPQYTEAIAQAKENLAKGDLIPTKEGYKGAVRLQEKSVEEVAAEHEKRKITV